MALDLNQYDFPFSYAPHPPFLLHFVLSPVTFDSCLYIFLLRFSLLFSGISMLDRLIYHYLSKIHREGNGTALQYACLENPMDGGAWQAAVHGVAKSWPRLSGFTFTFHFCALEKEMATHSSVLAWRIPGAGEPGGLLSVGSQSRTQLKRLSSNSSRSKQNSVFFKLKNDYLTEQLFYQAH